MRQNTVIIHYCGRNKPWKPGYVGILDVFYRELKEQQARLHPADHLVPHIQYFPHEILALFCNTSQFSCRGVLCFFGKCQEENGQRRKNSMESSHAVKTEKKFACRNLRANFFRKCLRQS